MRFTKHHRFNHAKYCVVSNDLDEHAFTQSFGAFTYEQLSPGRLTAELKEVHFEGLSLHRETTNLAIRRRGDLQENRYIFALSLTSNSQVFYSGQKLAADNLMCGCGQQLDILTPDSHTLLILTVDQTLLAAIWQRMYGKPLANWWAHHLALSVSQTNVFHMRDKHVKVMQHATELLDLKDVETTDAKLQSLRDDILIEWIEAIPPLVNTSTVQANKKRMDLVDRVCQLMLAHAHEPLSMQEICDIAGVSKRKLSECFQCVLGVSPMQYWRIMRLNGAHRDLKLGTESSIVKVAALRWGYKESGAFAYAYKKYFLETPSDTLSNRKVPNSNARKHTSVNP